MSIKVIEGKVNINSDLKEVGAKLKLNEAEEERLIRLGFAEAIDETEEEIEDFSDKNKKGGK
jgi:hypothetical protein